MMEYSTNGFAIAMNCPSTRPGLKKRMIHQGGVVLFFALIALVVMSLAAVALIRSVDTGTVIAGNLAFRQAATTSGDGGVEGAIGWLELTNKNNLAKDPTKDATHPFNQTNAAAGYYSFVNPGISMTDDATWSAAGSALVGTDESGNTMRYIIQRMCRTENQLLSPANCLMADVTVDNSSKRVRSSTEAGADTASSFLPPLYRVTVRISGPKNTVSYVQAFVY